MGITVSVGVSLSVSVSVGVSMTFSLDDGLLNNFGNNWSLVGFLYYCLLEYFMDNNILLFFISSVDVLLVNDGHVFLFN